MGLKHLILKNRGQISLEAGVLILAVVAVAMVAAYTYISSILEATFTINETANSTVGTYNAAVDAVTESVANLSNK